MPAVTISIRNGNTGAVTTAASAADVIAAINRGDDILFNGQTAILTNMAGNWLVQGQPVATWFMPAPPATGPTVQSPDFVQSPPFVAIDCGPGFIPAPDGSMRCVDPSVVPGFIPSPPVIRTDPFPITAGGSLNVTPGTLIILAIAAYLLFRK